MKVNVCINICAFAIRDIELEVIDKMSTNTTTKCNIYNMHWIRQICNKLHI